jgi:ADP-heptose:LPS heptosyltransferase
MKIVTRRVETRRPDKLQRILSLGEFADKRNQILIQRNVGGLGDIFMHRMMFEDFKRIMPAAQIHFACPRQYHDALTDHPFIDKILDSATVDRFQYIVSYNTTTACGRYELRMYPFSGLNRSDIWAQYCGVHLTNHNMHIRMTPEELAWGRDKLEQNRDRPGPIVLMTPVSAMDNKNLLYHQTEGTVKGLWERGNCVIGLHYNPLPHFTKLHAPCIYKLSLRQWMSVIAAADYVVSVDTAAFHCAGGMGKPLTGIFTFANAETYGRYYKNSELVQGPCPAGYNGCYDWGRCPVTKSNPKPCLTNITPLSILSAFDRLVSRFTVSGNEQGHLNKISLI